MKYPAGLFHCSVFCTCLHLIVACECLDNKYAFEEKVYFFPDSKTIRLGDTLWVFCSFSCDRMVDLNSGDTVSFCDIPEVSTGFGFQALIPGPFGSPLGAANDFEYIKLVGDIFIDENPNNNNNVRSTARFEKIQEDYVLHLGFIAQHTGQYVIAISFPPNLLLEENKRNTCENRGDFAFRIVNEDPHKEFLYEFWGVDYPEPGIEYDNDYCFEVVN